ncbi:phosphoribosylpyrophosphate synthetase [Terrimonas sp.]|uniref:phosphoribosylpyrophosphate synthetase n=1 Tax=Terrimonas sp. TaxID=1914338 RepID=UPI000D514AB1|nr:phosphoribosylpyrophosphate synthetase [Terrimonas sp.]PVD52385.1 phosphoribosylpyrophosphate synthetase [Terrimonas sp.]
MKNYKSLTDALDDLKQRGYKEDFKTQTTCLYCGDIDVRLDPQDFNIDESYSFKEDANGSCLLLAITSSTGLKGTVVDNYSYESCSINFEMAKKVQESIKNRSCIS